MSTRQGLKEPPPGCKIFKGEGLLLDLDTKESVIQFQKNLSLIDELYGVEKVRVWKSRSKGTHAFVQVKTLPRDPFELFSAQLILGSDPVREYCSIKDWKDHGIKPADSNVLFKPMGHWEKFMQKVYARLEQFDYQQRVKKMWKERRK